MNVTYSTNAWGPVLAFWAAPNNVNGAYYYCPSDLEKALSDISEAGYESFEIFDGNLLDYVGREDEFKKLMDKYSLSLKGVYIACNFIYDEILPEELDRIKRAASFAKRFGATEVPMGGGAVRFGGIRESDYEKLGKGLEQARIMCEEMGMQLSFHPHMGSLVESPQQLDKVMAHTSVKLCPDTGHVKAGGGDPLTVIKKYIDRIYYIHLKDITADGMFAPLGEGTIDFDPIISELKNSSIDVHIAIECDGWSGEAGKGAQITADYLKNRI